MKRWLKRAFWLLALTALVVPAAAGAWVWQYLHQPYRGYGGEQLFDVEPGTDAATILEHLEEVGVLPDALLARVFLVYRLGDPSLKAGEYRFAEPLSTPQVLDMLIRGRVVTYPVTIIEGLVIAEIAATLAARGFGDADTLRLEMGRGDLVADLDPQAENLEGYLYPDTYHFARGTTESEIVAAMVRTFRSKLAAEVAPLLEGARPKADKWWAAAGGPTIREIVTLASIVEKEAQVDDERARIAGVYALRLRIGMALYADPTVIYALRLTGAWDGNIRRKDLKLDSPYNTYIYPGLPPGPICSPGVASMIAAADPAETGHLYFVSRNDGTHVFAKTLADHNRNVNRWQKQYWRQRWARERRSR